MSQVKTEPGTNTIALVVNHWHNEAPGGANPPRMSIYKQTVATYEDRKKEANNRAKGMPLG